MTEDKALEGYTAEGVDRKEELSLYCSQITLDPVWELLDEGTVNRGRNEIRLFSLPRPETVLLVLVSSLTNRRLGQVEEETVYLVLERGSVVLVRDHPARDWKDCGDHLVTVASCRKEMGKQRHREDNWPL